MVDVDAAFSCDPWRSLTPNSTREAIADGACVHDVYGTSVAASFGTAVNALLAYKIFPPHRMRAHICTDHGSVALGATIVQRISLRLAVIETPVRVVEFERDGDGVTLEIETWSRAGHWLATVGRLLARSLQRRFTEEAIAWFKTSVE